MERQVIHLNIADFSVAVERMHDSSIRTRPLIIAPQVDRARVYDMSEEAYQEGVRKNMPLLQARRRCPRATILPPTPMRYEQAIRSCMHHILPFSPRIELAPGRGHLYLDVTGTHRLFGPPPDIGWRLRKILRRELGLDPIWSVAPNKLVAKVASRVVKPVGEYIVPAGEEQTFLAPLPLSLLPSVTYSVLSRLSEMGIHSVAQAASLSLSDLCLLCGQRAEILYQHLRAIDRSPVYNSTTTHNIFSAQHDFMPDTNQEDVVLAAVRALAGKLGYLLRKEKRGCQRMTIILTYSDGVQNSRQERCKKNKLIATDREIEQFSSTLLFRCWHRRICLRTAVLICTRTVPAVQQLSLFDEVNKKHKKEQAMNKAVDVLHTKFGRSILTRGTRV